MPVLIRPSPAFTESTTPVGKTPKVPSPNIICDAVPAPVILITPLAIRGELVIKKAEEPDNPTLVKPPPVPVDAKLISLAVSVIITELSADTRDLKFNVSPTLSFQTPIPVPTFAAKFGSPVVVISI